MCNIFFVSYHCISVNVTIVTAGARLSYSEVLPQWESNRIWRRQVIELYCDGWIVEVGTQIVLLSINMCAPHIVNVYVVIVAWCVVSLCGGSDTRA